MDFTTILYILGGIAVGFVLGMIAEMVADNEHLARAERRNECLKMENEALKSGKTEIIEIVDKRSKPDDVDFSQKW